MNEPINPAEGFDERVSRVPIIKELVAAVIELKRPQPPSHEAVTALSKLISDTHNILGGAPTNELVTEAAQRIVSERDFLKEQLSTQAQAIDKVFTITRAGRTCPEGIVEAATRLVEERDALREQVAELSDEVHSRYDRYKAEIDKVCAERDRIQAELNYATSRTREIMAERDGAIKRLKQIRDQLGS